METHQKFNEFMEYIKSLKLKDSDLYEQYFMMKSASKVLEERIDELQTMIIEEMQFMKLEKQQFEFGSFTITNRKTFKYSENVEKLNSTLKDLKKEEESNGKAVCEVKQGLLFKS